MGHAEKPEFLLFSKSSYAQLERLHSPMIFGSLEAIE